MHMYLGVIWKMGTNTGDELVSVSRFCGRLTHILSKMSISLCKQSEQILLMGLLVQLNLTSLKFCCMGHGILMCLKSSNSLNGSLPESVPARANFPSTSFCFRSWGFCSSWLNLMSFNSLSPVKPATAVPLQELHTCYSPLAQYPGM